jgi:uncharacterized protein YqeY
MALLRTTRGTSITPEMLTRRDRRLGTSSKRCIAGADAWVASRPVAEPVRDRFRAALRAAMKARDDVAVSALRSTLGAIDNAEAVVVPVDDTPTTGVIAGAVSGLGASDVPRRELSEERMFAIIRSEVAERRATAATFEAAGQGAHAQRLVAEADLLDGFL